MSVDLFEPAIPVEVAVPSRAVLLAGLPRVERPPGLHDRPEMGVREALRIVNSVSGSSHLLVHAARVLALVATSVEHRVRSAEMRAADAEAVTEMALKLAMHYAALLGSADLTSGRDSAPSSFAVMKESEAA